MGETLQNFFSNISTQDYVYLSISFAFFIVFILTGVEKIYKSYLGIILGIFLFVSINISLGNIVETEEPMGWWKNLFYVNRDWVSVYSILLIPLLAFLIPLNKNIGFRVSKNVTINYLTLFIFGVFFYSFLMSVFLSIYGNKFLFKIPESTINSIGQSSLLTSLFGYFEPSKIFIFISQYDYVINLMVIVFIFYKMTIGGVIDYIMMNLFKALGRLFEKKYHDEQESHDLSDGQENNA